MTAQKTTVLTTLFADICDSVGLYERVGDQRAHDMVEKSMHVMVSLTLRHGGCVIRTQGDGVLCTFATPDQAFAAAQEMQVSHTTGMVEIKIGFNHGPAIARDGDVYGDAVNLAARIMHLAQSGEILTTEDTVAMLPRSQREQAHLIDRTTMKGKRVATGIYSLSRNDDSQEMTLIEKVPSHSGVEPVAQLKLRYGNQSLLLSGSEPALVIGRGNDCGLLIPSTRVSRRHVSIEQKRDQFLITDHSTNGTYVMIANGPPVFLKRESTRLLGSGVLSLGASLEESSENLVQFEQIPSHSKLSTR